MPRSDASLERVARPVGRILSLSSLLETFRFRFFMSGSSGYFTKQERIEVAGVNDLQIRSLLDRQQFSDPLGEAEKLGISSAAWPLFGLLWPSGAQLAKRMAARPLFSGERILEIGCGLALASLVTHRRGADVTATDCHPLAGSFLSANLLLNDMSPLQYRHGHWGSSNLLSGKYDLIIGSDVLYERDARGVLAAFIGRHADSACEVWIVDPNRGNRSAFSRQMEGLGFSMSEEKLDHLASPGFDAYRGRLLTYRRD